MQNNSTLTVISAEPEIEESVPIWMCKRSVEPSACCKGIFFLQYTHHKWVVTCGLQSVACFTFWHKTCAHLWKRWSTIQIMYPLQISWLWWLLLCDGFCRVMAFVVFFGHILLCRQPFWGSSNHASIVYCSLKPLWTGMGEVVPAWTSPTLHPPCRPTVL